MKTVKASFFEVISFNICLTAFSSNCPKTHNKANKTQNPTKYAGLGFLKPSFS